MSDNAVVYVVDDDEALRVSVRRLLEQVGLHVQTFALVDDFLLAYSHDVPACLVVDVRMPGMSGIDLQIRLSQDGIDLPVIIVTGHGDVQMAVEAMRRGAIDFLEKPYRAQALLDSIHRGLGMNRSQRRRKREAEELEGRFAQLTAREREVTELVVEGWTNKEIARALGVTPQAIDARRSKAMVKLGVRTIPQLVEYTLRHAWSKQGYALPALVNESIAGQP